MQHARAAEKRNISPPFPPTAMQQEERFRGCLLGLACGDAVGTTVEFTQPGAFPPVQDMTGGGPFRLQPGQWTDDTSLALCLAASLLERGGFDPGDQLQRYLRWQREGYFSSTGDCFDIGGTVAAALRRFEQTGEPYCGSTNPRTAGNGSIMRLAPVPMRFYYNPARAMDLAADSSRTTHAAPAALDACRYLAGLIVGALDGVDKDELLAPHYTPAPGYWEESPLGPEIDEIAAGSFHHREPPEIRGTGYVVRSLEAALWAFARGGSFREGCLLAVNLGEDADTTAAVYGQLAGAFYGEGGIPAEWLSKLAMRGKIAALADQLHQAATGSVGP
jgi:ADP-ribosyl-[dinitrogen reductase] hydrolase